MGSAYNTNKPSKEFTEAAQVETTVNESFNRRQVLLTKVADESMMKQIFIITQNKHL